jgi:hypothetical protein
MSSIPPNLPPKSVSPLLTNYLANYNPSYHQTYESQSHPVSASTDPYSTSSATYSSPSEWEPSPLAYSHHSPHPQTPYYAPPSYGTIIDVGIPPESPFSFQSEGDRECCCYHCSPTHVNAEPRLPLQHPQRIPQRRPETQRYVSLPRFRRTSSPTCRESGKEIAAKIFLFYCMIIAMALVIYLIYSVWSEWNCIDRPSSWPMDAC